MRVVVTLTASVARGVNRLSPGRTPPLTCCPAVATRNSRSRGVIRSSSFAATSLAIEFARNGTGAGA